MEEIKRLVLTQETEEDSVVSLSLRPERLTDFVDQAELVKGLQVAISAAKKREEPLEHTLFSGPPGLGKTSLSHIIANEMGGRITVEGSEKTRIFEKDLEPYEIEPGSPLN